VAASARRARAAPPGRPSGCPECCLGCGLGATRRVPVRGRRARYACSAHHRHSCGVAELPAAMHRRQTRVGWRHL
jgi:hypothetical protein